MAIVVQDDRGGQAQTPEEWRKARKRQPTDTGCKKQKTDGESFPEADAPRSNRSIGAMRAIEVRIERVVEEHAADVHQRHRRGHCRQARGVADHTAAGDDRAGEDVGPDCRKIRKARKQQVGARARQTGSYDSSRRRTQVSSRAIAVHTSTLRCSAGNTSQV